jgi:hypothetical protein
MRDGIRYFEFWVFLSALRSSLILRVYIQMEVVRLIKFAWLRNRSGFPFQKLSGKMQYWNHVPNEYCLTKKHYLAKNLKSYLASHISTLPAEAQRYAVAWTLWLTGAD